VATNIHLDDQQIQLPIYQSLVMVLLVLMEYHL